MASNLENAFKEINKRFGKNAIVVLGDSEPEKINFRWWVCQR